MTAQATLRVDARCQLGESILWCEREQVLWWTDIQQARLWRYSPDSGQQWQWALPDRAGSLALCEDGGLLLGLAKGLHHLPADAFAADVLPAAPLWMPVELDKPGHRINDGRCDREGNFVFGTLNEDAAKAPSGAFYQYSRRHGLRALALGGVAIPNSLCFSPEGDRLYYCDSLSGSIRQCRYDAARAWVGEAQTFAAVAAPAEPDGATVDSEGRLWSARWGVGQVVCHAADGRVLQVIDVPVAQPTCVSLGGPALDTLYISSAWDGLDDAARERQPQAGGVFALALAGVRGLAEARFAL